MGAKFLCCLPLRLGVLVISVIQFLICGGVAGLLWWALCFNHKNDLSVVVGNMKTTVIIVGVIYTVAALVGLLGFLGAIFKKNGFVKSFFVLLATVFGFQVGSSIWYLITFYRTRGQPVEKCINGSTDTEKIAACQALAAYSRVPQGAMIASVIVPIIVQGYACYVVYQYSKRLTKQRLDKERLSTAFNSSGATYQPVKSTEDSYPLTHGKTYPYADAPNSFGSSAPHSGGHYNNNAGNKV